MTLYGTITSKGFLFCNKLKTYSIHIYVNYLYSKYIIYQIFENKII